MTGFLANGDGGGVDTGGDDTLVTGWCRTIGTWTAWIGCCQFVSSPAIWVFRWRRCTRGGIGVTVSLGSVPAGMSDTDGVTSRHGSREGSRTKRRCPRQAIRVGRSDRDDHAWQLGTIDIQADWRAMRRRRRGPDRHHSPTEEQRLVDLGVSGRRRGCRDDPVPDRR